LTATTSPGDEKSRAHVRQKARGLARASKPWLGYTWFMTFGTFLPLPIFLSGYVAQLTFIGAPLARRMFRYALVVPTLGQPPPGDEKLKAREGKPRTRRPFVERIRAYAPPRLIERHGKPVPMALRVVWFVLVGWWLGAIWVVLAWSLLLLPYPLLDAIRGVLEELPSVMTLAWPKAAGSTSQT
jgi:uncharacterized membrane protein YccF (DUF307 family)